jgi:tRNA dimethylallyltransferase
MGEQPEKKFLLVLAGPTASGKTNHAILLAQAFNTEIISADSRQFYKELKIGVASPTEEEMRKVPHHFIAHLSITDYYNASIYETDVLAKLDNLFRQHQLVVLTGGSGLYIDTVCHGIDDLPEVDKQLRDELIMQLKDMGLEYLRERLKQLDPETYHKIDLSNPKRILKALEISLQTGKPYSSFLTRARKERPFRIIKTGLLPPREELYEMINRRVDKMLDRGLLEEAKTLLPHKEINALNTVGYKELFDYFENRISLEEAIRQIKRNTRHYAKRQVTWFMRDKEYQWFRPGQTSEMISFINEKMNSN